MSGAAPSRFRMRRLVAVARALVYALAAAILAWSFIAIDSNSHSVSDTLIGFVPIAVLVVAVAIGVDVILRRAAAGQPRA